MTDPHPDDNALRDLLAGSLTEPQQQALEERLSAEPELRERLDALTAAAEFTAAYIPPQPSPPPNTAELDHLIETLRSTSPEAVPPPRKPDLDPAAFLAPPRTDGALGSLGNYDVLGVIGRGGMGVVFSARDPHLQRTVAIKTLSPPLAANPVARDQFLREARAAAALDHEHILAIHAVDQHDNVPYFVMPLVTGPSLHGRLAPGTPLPVDEVLRYGTAIAAALTAAHARGIVHRDIKPSNMLTDTANRRIWIADFGIAHPAGDDPGTPAGTPHYLSPEQAAGQPSTTASDLFALGVVLYQMATGKLPFDGTSTAEVLSAVSDHHPPSAASLNPAVPAGLDRLIDSLLAKSPEQRPASASAVAETLDRLGQPELGRRRLVVFGVFATTIAAAAAVLSPDDDRPLPPKQRPLFSLLGDERGFPSLQAALDASTPDAATVLINASATIEFEPLTTPPHPVVIRPARGASPTLRFSEVDAPMFTARGPLELRHLTIVQRAVRRSTPRIPPVVLSAGPPVTIDHCRIARIAPPVGRVPDGDFALEILPPVVRFEAPSTLTLSRSEIYAVRGVCVSALIPEAATSVHIDNCIIATRRLVEVTAEAGTGLAVRLDHNLLMASALFDFLPNPTHPDLVVEAYNNLFELRGGIAWARGRNPEDIAATTSWSGSSNIYEIPHVAIHYGGAFDLNNANAPSQHAFDDWLALPFVEESGSVSENIRASDELNLRTTRPDSITADNFDLPGKTDGAAPQTGPDLSDIGPRGRPAPTAESL